MSEYVYGSCPNGHGVIGLNGVAVCFDCGYRPYHPRVLNKHKHGIPAGAVYIGRGSPWGNPFRIDKNNSRDDVCNRFELEVLPNLDVSALRGKDLVCFCAPKRCHGDAILKKANS
jgi:hypothetical protein